jgi:hypothetical protein
LALTAAALWSLTPREYSALRKVWSLNREHLELRFAEIQATLHNIHRDRDKHPAAFQPREFMPGAKDTPEDPRAKGIAMMERIKAQAIAFNINKKRKVKNG